MARGNTRRYYFNHESMKISEEENIAHGKDILPFQLDFRTCGSSGEARCVYSPQMFNEKTYSLTDLAMF
jgi:hypothetical protein